MKSIVTEKESQKQELTFPALMKAVKRDYVVLFNGLSEGVVCWSECSDKPIGYYSECWIEASCKAKWQPFTGTITLSND